MKTLVRPMTVIFAYWVANWRQLRIIFFGKFEDYEQTLTYSEVDAFNIFGIYIPWRVHYVQISSVHTLSGRACILYKSPHLTNNERKEYIRRIEAWREMYNRKNSRGTYEF